MAGNCKPSIAGLGREASYTVLAMSSSQESGGTVNNCGLFNGTNPNELNTSNVFYWKYLSNFLEIEINEDCNIWRCGTKSWPTAIGTLNVFLYNESTSSYDNITSTVNQTITAITNDNWEKTFTKLKKGKYKFTTGNGLRLDSEWYIEGITRSLLKSNNKYYSIKKECYDSTTKTYTEITDITDESFLTYGFNIQDLTTELTINSETFKPIDKFEQFSIVSLEDKTLNLSGIKSTKELIIGKESFVSKIADNIDFFKLNDEASVNIKIVFSIDKGLTWKTYDFEQLIFKDIPDVIIPNKNYSEFTQTDIQNWNDSTNKISEVGIPANLLNTINFNVLKAENFKFGYVLSASSATGIDKMKQLIWRFDSKGIMQKCSDNEIIQQIYYGGIKIIPKINTDILKINITYEGIGGGTASDLVIDKTDDDIQNDINEVWKINSSK